MYDINAQRYELPPTSVALVALSSSVVSSLARPEPAADTDSFLYS